MLRKPSYGSLIIIYGTLYEISQLGIFEKQYLKPQISTICECKHSNILGSQTE